MSVIPKLTALFADSEVKGDNACIVNLGVIEENNGESDEESVFVVFHFPREDEVRSDSESAG